jgi:predicted transcriptional regulator of viral defense system
LKKYRFDYLLVFENNLISHRVACYIEEFEIDFDFKAKFEGIAKNINFDPTIVRKILKVSNNYMRVNYSN